MINAALGRLERVEERGEATQPQALLTVSQAAELLGVTTRTVYAMVKEARIPFLHIGRSLRFRAADRDEWLAQRTNHAVQRRRR